jgi:CyaY protein
MTESEFNSLADSALERISSAIDESGADCDAGLGQGGVLNIEFPDGARIIVNRHTAAREIWVAAKSGGYHFRLAEERWVNTRDGSELYSALSRLLTEQAGSPIDLRA